MTLRKIIKNRAMFPSDEAVYKILYFSLEKYQQTIDNADTELERSDEPIRHHFREPAAERQSDQQLVYTKFLTRSLIVLTKK